MTTLTTDPLAPLLERLFAEAEAPSTPERRAVLRGAPAASYRDFYFAAKDLYLAVSRETAALLYMLVRGTSARDVVEFGTSFGISTLHLAAGLRDNGGGRLITSEFEPSKAATARENFAAAGLDDLIELREGDALETLATGLPEAIDLVLMDGAKHLYPDVLDLLEPHLAPRALVVADNAERSPEYLRRVRSPAWISVPFGGDVELSMRTA
ncbi:MAG TPA: O-methyltransferase [Solirubrobacter sp.]|nr:O-methyltransferase [Solirubrobacter sp.]